MVACSPFRSEGVVPSHSLAVLGEAVALTLALPFSAGVEQTRVRVLLVLRRETGRQSAPEDFHSERVHWTAHHQGWLAAVQRGRRRSWRQSCCSEGKRIRHR